MEKAYDEDDMQKLARVFTMLQSCMVEVMKDQGGMGYKIPHMDKARMQSEERLPIALKWDGELYQKTFEIIVDH